MNKATWMVGLVALSLALASPAAAQETAPPSSTSEQRAIGNTMWVTGLSVLGATWALTGITSTTLVKVANARDVTIYESWIPVVGPWIMVGDSRGFDTTQMALTVTSAIVQTLALGAFIAGLVLENDAPSDATAARIWIAPTFASGSTGISAFGVF